MCIHIVNKLINNDFIVKLGKSMSVNIEKPIYLTDIFKSSIRYKNKKYLHQKSLIVVAVFEKYTF